MPDKKEKALKREPEQGIVPADPNPEPVVDIGTGTGIYAMADQSGESASNLQRYFVLTLAQR